MAMRSSSRRGHQAPLISIQTGCTQPVLRAGTLYIVLLGVRASEQNVYSGCDHRSVTAGEAANIAYNEARPTRWRGVYQRVEDGDIILNTYRRYGRMQVARMAATGRRAGPLHLHTYMTPYRPWEQARRIRVS